MGQDLAREFGELGPDAKPLAIKLSGGANFGGTGSTTVTLKAAYSSDTLYMLIQYADPTNSQKRGPYQKQADGSWKKLVDPADKGGDDNVYYEDKWAFLWPINNSVWRPRAALFSFGRRPDRGAGPRWHCQGVPLGP